MSEEVAEQLPRIERMEAYLTNGYIVREEDAYYFEMCCQAYRVIYACQTIDEARKKISILYANEDLDLKELVDDVSKLFGDFFEINKTVMRRILERKYDYVYNIAIKKGDTFSANQALTNIAKLYRLHDKELVIPNLPKTLPEVKLTSDPQVFQEQKKYLDGAAAD